MNAKQRVLAVPFLVLGIVLASCRAGGDALVQTATPPAPTAAHVSTLSGALPTRLPTGTPGGAALTEEQGWVEMFWGITVDAGPGAANTPAAMNQYIIFHGPKAGPGEGSACQGCYVLELQPDAELLVPPEDSLGGGAVMFYPGESNQYRIRGTLTSQTTADAFLGRMPIFQVALLERLNVPRAGTAATPQQAAPAASPVPQQQAASGEPGPFPFLADPNTACAGTWGGDEVISCVEAGGWRSYEAPSMPEAAMCADGRMIVWLGYEIHIYRGGGYVKSLRMIGDWGSVAGIACGSGEGFWVRAGDYISYFDGASWTNYSAIEHFGSQGPKLHREITVAPNGDLWLTSPASIGRFDGRAWSIFAKGEGLQEDINVRGLVVDASGTVWAISQGCEEGCTGAAILPGRLLKFDGARWTMYPVPDDFNFDLMQLDRQNRIWVISDEKVYQGGTLAFYTVDPQSGAFVRQFQGQNPASSTRPAQMDRQGRAWVLGLNGLEVYDGAAWTTYRMDNSDLVSNQIHELTIFGDGPQRLPAVAQKAPGSVRGQLVDPNGKASYAGLQAELCLNELVISYFTGKTPCESQGYHALTTMDAGGNFLFTGVPVGRYYLAVETAPGKWQGVVQTGGTGGEAFEVSAGQETQLGAIKVTDQ